MLNKSNKNNENYKIKEQIKKIYNYQSKYQPND